MNTIIPQGVFDSLDNSLARNAKALKDPSIANLRQRIQSNARINRDGVDVPTKYLSLALTSIQRIVATNGKKYNSLGDEMLIEDLTDVLALPVKGESADVSAFTNVDTAPATPAIPASVEAVVVDCLVPLDDESTATEAYTFPPTPIAGAETGRAAQIYESFVRKFIWQIRTESKLAEAELIFWKTSTPEQRRVDEELARSQMPKLKQKWVDALRA